MVFLPQRSPVAHQKTALVRDVEITLDPGRAHSRCAGIGAAAVEHDLRGARLADPADRRMSLQPIGGAIVALGGQPLFRPPPPIFLPPPNPGLIDENSEVRGTACRRS